MSKIGLHIKLGERDQYALFCQSLPSVIVSTNDGGALSEVKTISGGYTYTVYRDVTVYLEAPMEWNVPGTDMVALARHYYPLLKQKWLLNPGNDFYQLTNEQSGGDGQDVEGNLIKLIAYERELMRLANADGIRVCVLSLATGSPGNYDLWEQYCLPFVVEAWAGGNAYGRHVYGLGDLVDANGNVLDGNPWRPIREANHLLDLGHRGAVILTECGIDGGMSFPGDARFVAQLTGYERAIRSHPLIVGVACWTVGLWHTANCQSALPELAQYNLQNPTPKWTVPIMPLPTSCFDPAKEIIMLVPPTLTEAQRVTLADWAYNGIPGYTRGTSSRHTYTHSHVTAINTVLAGMVTSQLYIVDGHLIGTGLDREWMEANCPQILNTRTVVFIRTDNPSFVMTHWPTGYRIVTQRWGNNPAYYGQFGLPGHEGNDIRAYDNTPVYSVASGVVYAVYTDISQAYGINVRINHNDGYQTVYAHLKSATVVVGEVVSGGRLIGQADNTGNSFGAHLHITLKRPGYTYVDSFGTWPNSIHNPEPFLMQVAPEAYNPVPPDPIPGYASVGLNARADPGDLADVEIEEFRLLRPNIIKVLSAHSPGGGTVNRRGIGNLAVAHPGIPFVVRAFLNFGGRNITAQQFFTDTINDVQRSVGAIGAGHEIWIELHNEPNLVSEGLGTSWADGTGFSIWLQALLTLYRTTFPATIKLMFPGLSPGPTMAGVRQDAGTFLTQSAMAIGLCDGIGIHAYWSQSASMQSALDHVLTVVNKYPNTPKFVTEASRNDRPSVVSPQTYAAEYLSFAQRLKAYSQMRGVMFYVASASDPVYQPESWIVGGASKGIAAIMGNRGGIAVS